MITSILKSIKKDLGVSPDDANFDQDIIADINLVFLKLTQLGVGPTVGFFIEDDTTNWENYVSDAFIHKPLESYMYMEVKKVFDPPSSAAMLDVLNQSIREYECRIRDWAEEKGLTT